MIGRAGLNALLPLDDNIQHATIVHADEESLNMMSVLFENSAYYDEQSCCFVLRKMEIVCSSISYLWAGGRQALGCFHRCCQRQLDFVDGRIHAYTQPFFRLVITRRVRMWPPHCFHLEANFEAGLISPDLSHVLLGEIQSTHSTTATVSQQGQEKRNQF